MKEITVNWHIIEKCNYKCDYCFAKYTESETKEVYHSKSQIDTVLQKTYDFFSQKYAGYEIRLNIAGGEPFLAKNFEYIIRKASEVGFNISIITNGSNITNSFIEKNAKYISMFAISIDSTSNEINKKIGRVSANNYLKLSKILQNIESLRYANPTIKIKINTVINRYNYNQYLGAFIDLISPNKWKVLQAVSLSKQIYCTDQNYQEFLEKHANIQTKIYKESNTDMEESYIMLDPYARFYQNTSKTYQYSKSILEIPVADAFKSVKFDLSKYSNRYEH
jgi:radical S-adenosyl methionine domain-containing protein 2